MKKFQFSMQKILDLKQNVLDAEKNRLGQLQGRRRQLEDEIAALNRASCDIAMEMRDAQATGVTIAELMGFNARRSNIRLQLEDLAKKRADIQKNIEKQTLVVVEASREVSKFEKIEERQLEIYRETEKKAEAARIEDMIVTNVTRRSAV